MYVCTIWPYWHGTKSDGWLNYVTVCCQILFCQCLATVYDKTFEGRNFAVCVLPTMGNT